MRVKSRRPNISYQIGAFFYAFRRCHVLAGRLWRKERRTMTYPCRVDCISYCSHGHIIIGAWFLQKDSAKSTLCSLGILVPGFSFGDYLTTAPNGLLEDSTSLWTYGGGR